MRGAPRGCADRCEIDPNRHQPHQHHHHPHNHRHNQPPQRKSIPTPTTNPTTTPYHHPKTTTTTTTKAMFMKLLYFFFLMRAHWNSAARRTLPGNVLCDQRLAANTLELAQYITHRTLPCAQSQLISKKNVALVFIPCISHNLYLSSCGFDTMQVCFCSSHSKLTSRSCNLDKSSPRW